MTKEFEIDDDLHPIDRPLCARCGHPADWHRLDDSRNVPPTDPNAMFRCIGYDCTRPGPPKALCDVGCPDYTRSDGAPVR